MKFGLRQAYLSHIFGFVKHINMFFQGSNSIIAYFVPKLQAFLRKLDLWIKTLNPSRVTCLKTFFTSKQRKVISKNLLPSKTAKNGVGALFFERRW